MQTKPRLFLDMDGVLADFNSAARQLLGASRSEAEHAEKNGRWPADQWIEIAGQANFYRHLPKMPMADQMVELALKFRDNLDYEILILSAIPSGNDMPDAFHDKIDWIHEHYGAQGFRVRFGPYSHDKVRHCRTNQDILVDDRTSNCRDWRAAGGRAVQVQPGLYDQALAELELLFRNLMVVTGRI